MAKRFSERIGKRESKAVIQTDTMDSDLKAGLWNVVYYHIIQPIQTQSVYIGVSAFEYFVQALWVDFFKKPLDGLPNSTSLVVEKIRSFYVLYSPMDVYDFIQFIADYCAEYDEDPFDCNEFIKDLNAILVRELSGYRFINRELSPVTNETEIAAIEEAANITANSPYKGASIHLADALEKLSDRHSPDYRNSIKESISAVEAVCQVISGTSNTTLGAALKIIEKTMPLHGALKQGLLSIYGYTSDGDGIRHALLEESSLNQEDALFMLVTCSAFVNYLIIKANKSTI